jgi:Tfp pilus assembly protein PilO
MSSKDLVLFNIILAGIPVAVYLIIWNPLFSGTGYQFYSPATPATSINAYRGELSGYTAVFEESNTLITKYKKLANSYKAVDRSIFDTIKKSIPDDIDRLNFVSEITAMIEKEGFEAGAIGVNPGPDLNGVKTVTFYFTVKGTYESIKALVRVFEQNARFMSVRSFSLTTPAQPGDPYTFTAAVDAYKLR